MKGITLIHEHMHIDLSGPKKDADCYLDVLDMAVDEMHELHCRGVDRIVECTNRGMGRNISQITKLEKCTGIDIIVSTGYYKEPFLPAEVYQLSIEQLAEIMIQEIEHEISNGKKASVIGEIGSSLDKITDLEEKVFLAACIAHKKTGCPIITHTTLGTMGIDQVHLFQNNDVDLRKVLISHVDLKKEFDSIVELLATGVNVGFDTIGKIGYLSDEIRKEWIMKLISMGYEKQIFVSMDITRKSHLRSNGGIGYCYLFDTFIEGLKKMGLSDSNLKQLLVDNPNRFLGGSL